MAFMLAEAGYNSEMGVRNSSGLTIAVKHVVCVSRSLAGCKETAQMINQKFPRQCGGDRSSAVSVDVANGADVKAVVDQLIKQHGVVDILVNNAGITKDGLLTRMSVENWEAVIATNLHSVFYFTRGLIGGMVKQRFGRVINIASVSGNVGNQGQTNYSASKAAVIGFTKALAKEVASANVTVNAVSPGFIESEMTKKLSPSKTKEMTKGIPTGRFGTAKEIGEIVLFLASEGASYVSGSVMVVDGGFISGGMHL